MAEPSEGAAESPDDRALLAAHVAGDPDAFGTLFRRHRGRLWAVALRTTGDPEEAADALQDALVSAFRRAGSFRGDAAVTTWLHRIVVNASLDRLRRRQVRAAVPLPDDTDEYVGPAEHVRAGFMAPNPVDPVEMVLDEERRNAVLRALDTLPPDQKVALVLVDLEGYSVEETAAILDCPPGTVKSRCSRGRTRLVPLLSSLRPVPDAGGEPAGPASRPRSRPRPGAGPRAGPGASPRASPRDDPRPGPGTGARPGPGEVPSRGGEPA